MQIDLFALFCSVLLAAYIYTVLMVGVTTRERLAGDTRRSYPVHLLHNLIGREIL